ncbi:hypothetical protein C8R44DRAFT_632817 [Mycena epipterygia]|nr:hypothetical protein C8R44DRAFT_632817 [Mycena epipterygia]
MATDVATGSPTPPPSIPLTTSSARETPAPPPQSDPRRSAKLSATPTIVPNKPPTSRADDNPPPSIQESRPPRPSTGSNRSNRSNRTAPLPPSPELRREEKPLEVPRASTTARPSTGLNGPSATAPESRRQEKPTEAPRSSMTAQRPPLQPSVSQMDTKYVNMLLALDGIPPMYNILANFFTWILLAGFVLFPGTFTNLQTNNELGAVGVTAVNVIKHLSLYVIAWVCTGIGAAGMLWLWYRWQANYIWLVNRIFMPGFLNSLAGVLSTLASVLGTQSATLSKSSKSTIVVTSAVAGICGGLTGFYMLVLIRRIKKQHDAEIGKQRAGKHGEGVVDVSKRKLVAKLV